MKIRKFIAGAAVAVFAALGVGLTAQSASAHTGDLSVTAVCNTQTGQYDFTAKLTTANTGLPGTTAWRVGTPNFEGTPTNANGMQGAIQTTGAQTITLTTFSLPGTTTGKGPWVYAHTTWTDGFKKGSDGQLYDNLKGDCKPPVVVPPQPADKVTSVPTDNPWLCSDENVKVTVTTTTITTKLVDNVWVEQPPVVTTTSTTRPFTPAEVEQNTKNCYVPPSAANPQAVITAVCGKADLTLKNPLVKDANQLTASFVVEIDGKFHKAYSVEAGAVVTDTFSFGEDTGTYKVEVFQAGTSEWKSIAKSDVASDCILPQPKDKVTNGDWSKPVFDCTSEAGDEVAIERTVTTTPYKLVEGKWVLDTENAKTTTEDGTYTVTAEDIEALDCAVVVPPTSQPKPTPSTTPAPPVSGGLAATGGDPVVTLWALSGGALMVALGALAVLFEARRRQVAKQKAPIEG